MAGSANANTSFFFSEIPTRDGSCCDVEELYGMPGITELEDDVFPSDFIPVLAAAYDVDPQYDGDDEDAAPAEWQPAAPMLRPYRLDVEPISPASPPPSIAIPPANFLPPPPTSPIAIPPANFLLQPPSPFYSPVFNEPAEEKPMMAAIGGGGSYLHYDVQDLVNGTRFC